MSRSTDSSSGTRRRYVLGASILAALAIIGFATSFGMESRDPQSMLAWLSQPFNAALRVLALAPDTGQVRRGFGGPPGTVTVSRPAERQMVEWDEYTGRFDPVETVEIRARVAGYLDTVHFKDGQQVAKGDLLFTIDPRPFERAVEQARAEVEQAHTKVENAKLDVDRGLPLLDRKVMSQKTFDDRANLKREAEAGVKVAEAKLHTAELDLFFTKVTAPISGRISRTLITAGNFITAGGAATPSLLTTIVSQDPVYLYFDVSEANTLKYKRLGLVAEGSGAGMSRSANAGGSGAGGIGIGEGNATTVEIALPDETGWLHRGRLNFTDNRLDVGTGTLRARAIVDNKNALFAPGMFAKVRIAATAPTTALLVPDAAIGSDQVAKFVLVVADDGTVTRKVVTLGSQTSGLRVVRSGIAATDWVIVNGLQRARPGQKVEAKREVLKVTEAVPVAGAAPATAAP